MQQFKILDQYVNSLQKLEPQILCEPQSWKIWKIS